MVNFSDLVEEVSLSGDKVKIDDILDKSIVLTGVQIKESKYAHKGVNWCTKIQFYYADDETEKRYVVFTGSTVIKDQMDRLQDAIRAENLDFAVVAKIQKVGNYYTIS